MSPSSRSEKNVDKLEAQEGIKHQTLYTKVFYKALTSHLISMHLYVEEKKQPTVIYHT
jgi:hypothetical protein